MKNILFVITSFRHGGTNKSLENLLSLLDTEKYQVDVFAMEHYGPYESKLPNCTILPKDKWLHALIAQFRDTKGITKLRSITLKVLRKLMTSLGMNLSVYLYKNAIHSISKNKSYDTVIAFSEGAPTAFAQHFKAPNKIAWIHCDYESYMLLNNQPDETTMYQAYQSIVCVSEFTKSNFVDIMTMFSTKTIAIHNILDTDLIKKQSKEEIADNRFTNNTFTIVSIGRFYFIKRFSIIPDIVNELVKKGCVFKWYIIGGDGNEEEKQNFLQKLNDYKLQDTLVVLGEKDNPYPYILKSHLLVSTSMTEACPYVVNEAKVLHIPVASADFGSAYEFIDNGINGVIAPVNHLAEKIATLIKENCEYSKLKNNISNFEYKNQELLIQIEKLLA